MPGAVVDPAVLADARVQDRSDPDVSSLSGRERAGVSLTWGVLGLIAVCVVGFLLVFAFGSDPAAVLGEPPSDPAALSAYVEHADTLRASRRAFLLQGIEATVQTVLFPVLTALLGYIFGSGIAR